MASLDSASVLCFDLLRRPGGAGVAEVIAVALRLGPADLPALRAAHRDDPERGRALATARGVALPPTTNEAMGVLRLRLHRLRDEAAAAEASAMLTEAQVCDRDAVLAVVRDDVLDWTWLAADGVRLQRHPEASAVVTDAVTAALAAPRLPTAVARRLLDPFRAASADAAARPPDLGPDPAAVRRVLDRIPVLDTDRLDKLSQRPAGRWDLQMHRACWAAYLTGRTRAAAAAQLAAALAVARRPDAIQIAVSGAWAGLSAAVQAAVVADVLDDATLCWLRRPWVAATNG